MRGKKPRMWQWSQFSGQRKAERGDCRDRHLAAPTFKILNQGRRHFSLSFSTKFFTAGGARKEGGREKKECRPLAIASEHEKKENNKHGFRFWFLLPPHDTHLQTRAEIGPLGERGKGKAETDPPRNAPPTPRRVFSKKALPLPLNSHSGRRW